MANRIFLCLWIATEVAAAAVAPDSLAIRPVSTETRLAIRLDGQWNFRITNHSLHPNHGFHHRWFAIPLDLIDENYERMPVPASFNDITESRLIRDFQGWSWYDRHFFTPPFNRKRRILLRFDSVNYVAWVYVNGINVAKHVGGHLPFVTDITNVVRRDHRPNHICVAVNNLLTPESLPQGMHVIIRNLTGHHRTFSPIRTDFDFFPYAGIQRSVWLMVVPNIRITDITVIPDISNHSTGIIHYRIMTTNMAKRNDYRIKIQLFNRRGHRMNVTDSSGNGDAGNGKFKGKILIPNVRLWWPFTMHPDPGYLYRMTVTIYKVTENPDESNLMIDRYHQPVGIRTVRISSRGQFLINETPFYFRGFGRHEEYDIRGRTVDPVMIQKDFNLMKWSGANSFRTAHYPYSEELMDEADRQGFVVIDECPAVGVNRYNIVLLMQHRLSLRELIERDKNRPGVVMWSVANEPDVDDLRAEGYFQDVCREAKHLDPARRPITAAIAALNPQNCQFCQWLDVIMINVYVGWYSFPGYPETAQSLVINRINDYRQQFHHPVMISEYGAEAIVGQQNEPSLMFGEDYQVEVMVEYHRAFDRLIAGDNKQANTTGTGNETNPAFIGEHIWNFADFQAVQGIARIGGKNHKGLFTRQRQPKMAARILRCRYWTMAEADGIRHASGLIYCPILLR